jgi:hypothetical protein
MRIVKTITRISKSDGIGSSPFQIKWILSILWSRFKVDASNDVHDFTLFKFLKDMPILILYTLLNAPTLNHDLSFKMNSIHFDTM